MEQICVLSFLSMNSFQDIRKRQVYLSVIVIYGVLGILYVFWHRDNLAVLLLGAVPAHTAARKRDRAMNSNVFQIPI